MITRDNPDPDLARAAGSFVEAFRHVFHYDWNHTHRCLKDFQMFSDGGTFMTPGLDNNGESNNWSARGALLDTYRALAELLRERGLHPDQLEEPAV
ncbi:MAG TPA: hypothetical protein VHX86_10815 [Tepidisphaeraceae bacterium]|jgi:hypothetical protein|nr:hypothetical protein [Tepidisphaeraceae bacterium]